MQDDHQVQTTTTTAMRPYIDQLEDSGGLEHGDHLGDHPFLHQDYYVLKSPTTTIYYPLEQPIFTTKAHVFQIDPNTKKKWLPASTTAVNVSYYFDSTRNTYRIISVEGSKAVINSTITPNMTFTKTSQKFGQWTDGRANTVYGLGFTSELDLAKFVDKFKEVKELTRQSQSQHPNGGTNGTDSPVHAPSTPDISSSPVNIPVNNKSSLSSQNELNERRNSSTSSLSGNTSESQLKYENDRLKIALAQSSANAKKWEVELQTLKNNNARLTTALQESTTNVEEWKKQLAMYKEESARMKKKMQELERGGSGSEQFQQQVHQLTDRVHQLETTNRHKEEEITDLTSKMQALQPFERQNRDLSERMKGLETENDQLKKQLETLQEHVNSTKTQQTRERQQIRDLNDQVSRKMSELSRLHDQVSSVLQH